MTLMWKNYLVSCAKVREDLKSQSATTSWKPDDIGDLSLVKNILAPDILRSVK
jgi:hypothetical protein